MALIYLLITAALSVPSVLATSMATSKSAATATGTGTPTPMTSMTITASASVPSDTSGLYSLESLPAYLSLTVSCLQNCLLPIGLDEPTNCDTQTNDCACLSAPVEAQEAITSCLSTVCSGVSGSQLSAYASTATSLYLSYCSARYPASALASASSADLSAISAASVAAVSMSAMSMSDMSMSAMSMSAMSMPSATASAVKTSNALATRNEGCSLLLGSILGALVAVAAL